MNIQYEEVAELGTRYWASRTVESLSERRIAITAPEAKESARRYIRSTYKNEGRPVRVRFRKVTNINYSYKPVLR